MKKGWLLLLPAAALAAVAGLAALRLLPDPAEPPDCRAPAGLTHIDATLARSAAAIAEKRRLRVVAIGSSSTLGTGASSPAMSYPSRLEAALAAALPGVSVAVVNRGVGGQDVGEEVGRLTRDVIALNPDLVIWQVGTNAVLRRDDPAADGQLIRRGIAVLAGRHIDVVLMDLQYAPRVLQRRGHDAMEEAIAAAARDTRVGLFRRWAIMQRWAATGQFGRNPMIGRDGLHMTDAGYGCLAADLAEGLVADLRSARPTAHAASAARSGAAPAAAGAITVW